MSEFLGFLLKGEVKLVIWSASGGNFTLKTSPTDIDTSVGEASSFNYSFSSFSAVFLAAVFRAVFFAAAATTLILPSLSNSAFSSFTSG